MNESIKKERRNHDCIREDRLIICTHSFIHIIDPDSVLYLQAKSNYCMIQVENEKPILASRPLKYFEKRLAKTHFLRVHNSYLLNTRKISGIRKNGCYTMILENKMEIPFRKRNVWPFYENLESNK